MFSLASVCREDRIWFPTLFLMTNLFCFLKMSIKATFVSFTSVNILLLFLQGINIPDWRTFNFLNQQKLSQFKKNCRQLNSCYSKISYENSYFCTTMRAIVTIESIYLQVWMPVAGNLFVCNKNKHIAIRI